MKPMTFNAKKIESTSLPLFQSSIAAGYPSPASSDIENEIDILELLLQHPEAMFFCRVTGDSMINAGIFHGDLLIVDSKTPPSHGDVVVAAIDGELTCKYLDLHRQCLLPGNEKYKPIRIPPNSDLIIEGIVKHSIRCHKH